MEEAKLTLALEKYGVEEESNMRREPAWSVKGDLSTLPNCSRAGENGNVGRKMESEGQKDKMLLAPKALEK